MQTPEVRGSPADGKESMRQWLSRLHAPGALRSLAGLLAAIAACPARASFLSGDLLDTAADGSRSFVIIVVPSSSSSSSGSSTCYPRRSPRSATIRSATRSRRCACSRSSSAGCSGRSRGCGRTRSRSGTGWRTARTSTRTTTTRWARSPRRRAPARGARPPARRARRDGGAGRPAPEAQGAKDELARLRVSRRPPSGRRRPPPRKGNA